MKKEMIELMALWEKKDKNGNTFYSGSLNGLDVVVFKNKFKESDRHPDFKVYLSKKEKREEQTGQRSTNPQRNDDIPF